ncbi:MAG: DNA polymerase III subunit alpha [Actinomycetes bacterium]
MKVRVSGGLLTMVKEESFIHLNVVSGYSFQYGTAMPHQLVERAGEFRMSALALTDRDGFAGGVRFLQACAREGISPIVGSNLAYSADGVRERRKSPAHGGVRIESALPRVTLLARDSWRGLARLISTIHSQQDRGVPILTRNILQEGSGFSILLGADSNIAHALSRRRPDLAAEHLREWREIAGERIVIECVSHFHREGIRSVEGAARLFKFAREHQVQAILTNQVRMLNKEDAPVADVLDAARKLVPLHHRHVERSNGEAYLKSPAEMSRIAHEIARAAGESGRDLLHDTIACGETHILNPGDYLGGIYLPEPEVVGGFSHGELIEILTQRCEAGLSWRYQSEALRIRGSYRLQEELSVIKSLGYESYFLTVADIATMARERGIRVAARGSGAGSLVCYLLGISGVDPIDHGLLMERFCSPLRRDLPDIDIDVESARRLEIYDAVFARYAPTGTWPAGPARTAAVSMVETYRARHAIRDVGAALGVPPADIGMVAKSFPHIRARSIKNALAELPELRNGSLQNSIGETKLGMWLSLAEKLDGLPRHLALHPCAVVLSDASLLDRAPTELSAQGYPMVAFDKDDVEAMGLLKLDILGVRMQSAMAYAIEEIKREQKEEVDLDSLSLDDKETFDLIKSTKTLGIFQVESPGQRELVGKFGPSSFNDLMIDISLFRPGPVKSDMITPFLKARHGWSEAKMIHPDLTEVLYETEGVVVFHEQVIRIISIIAGVSLAQADEYRRALGRRDGLIEFGEWFIARARERGYSPEVVNELWEVLCAFGSFGFCKAHAAAFALTTYQSAWLKQHYPAPFIAGLLTHDPGMYPKRLILDEARQLGVTLLPIEVNHSDITYRVEESDGRLALRMSLSDIHGISEKEAATIVASRPFLDIGDFMKRTRVSQPTAEKLVTIGAFDSLYGITSQSSQVIGRKRTLTRRDLFLYVSDVSKWGGSHVDQMALDLPAPQVVMSGLPDITLAERVRDELEILGMDLSCHVLDFYQSFLSELGVVPSRDLVKQRSGALVFVAGVKVASQTPPMRSGKRVVFLTLDDGTGCSDSTFFNDAQENYSYTLFHSWLLLTQGVVRRTGERGVSLRATGCWEITALYQLWLAEGIDAVREYVADRPATKATAQRTLIHPTGYRQSPYADIKPAGEGVRKLWHTSPGSVG